MFLIGLQEDKYIIKVNYYKFSKVILKDKVYEPLKSGQYIVESEWHPEVFILSPEHYKSSLINIFFLDFYLLIPCY